MSELKVDSFYIDDNYYYFILSSKGNYVPAFKTDLKGKREIKLIKNSDDVSDFREIESDDRIIKEYYILAAKRMLNR